MSSRISRAAFASPLSLLSLLSAVAVLGACSSTPKPQFQDEFFSNGTSPYMRSFDVANTEACEGARRALLSQGYMTTLTRNDTVDATKNFQPASDQHYTVEFHVVCTAGEDATNTSVMYVNAVQNGYALKKSDTSASVGLSILGSVSLPIRSNSDAMVKISSETIQKSTFYDSFFGLVSHYLRNAVRSSAIPGDAVTAQPLPAPLVSATPAPNVLTPALLPPTVPGAAAAPSTPAVTIVPLSPAKPLVPDTPAASSTAAAAAIMGSDALDPADPAPTPPTPLAPIVSDPQPTPALDPLNPSSSSNP
ncbi:DUF2242 domain-containing protein [Paraburkholderia phosphatilytica]|uniref:DUF2242 domain-containing protein n=1 Tax=Paraburkholderia phosphatilytica TaxID=2282883 RepID=UPI000E48DB18|nr:DUF2242 domain-containing protein [Paraburkholderia phosphatilytica]